MARALTVSGLIVAALVLLLFGLDLALGIPFGRKNVMVDAGFVVCAAVLAYMSWSTWRELA